MNLTPSQEQAIERQKRIMLKFNPNATFTVYQPHNTDVIRLVMEYTMPSLAGTDVHMSRSWSVGKKGKLDETEGVKLFR